MRRTLLTWWSTTCLSRVVALSDDVDSTDNFGYLHYRRDVGVVGNIGHHFTGEWRCHRSIESIHGVKGHVHCSNIWPVHTLLHHGGNGVPCLFRQRHMGGQVVVVVEGAAFT
jgi:hypothetical protein